MTEKNTHLGKVQVPVVQVVDDPPGRADEDVDAHAQRALLRRVPGQAPLLGQDIHTGSRSTSTKPKMQMTMTTRPPSQMFVMHIHRR